MSINLLPHHFIGGNGRLASLKRVVLMVVVLLAITSNSFAQITYEIIDGLKYQIDSDTKTAIVVCHYYTGNIVVPDKVKASDGYEYSVVGVGRSFSENSSITSITLPSNITSLDDYCFSNCVQLYNIVIPSSVKTLGAYCLCRCIRLKQITLPSSIISLGAGCFSDCKALGSIAIPSSVTKLGPSCFSGCPIKRIVIPSSVTFIGEGCFAGCEQLGTVELSSSITSLGSSCFYNCHVLENITIPSTVTTLGSSCFSCCYNLKNIVIPSSVTSLGYLCFKDCSSLTNITIPSSVTSLGDYSFWGCTKLEQATFKGKCPNNISNCSLPETCILYVSKSYLQDYKDVLGSKYPYIYASKDDGEDTPSEQCATPTITYAAGKLRFASSTPGAEYHSTITDTDMMNDKYVEDGVLELSATYHITAYATAEGFQPSEKATAILYWINANLEDGTSTNVNQAKTRGIVATSSDGTITLSGLDNNEEVRFYSVDGKQIGSARAVDGVASQAVSTAANSLVIAKIGGQSIKIAVK